MELALTIISNTERSMQSNARHLLHMPRIVDCGKIGCSTSDRLSLCAAVPPGSEFLGNSVSKSTGVFNWCQHQCDCQCTAAAGTNGRKMLDDA
jgi:hypothetical protein